MATFDDDDLGGSTFRQVNLNDSRFREVSLRRADIRLANLHEIRIREASLRGAQIRGADLRDVELDGDADGLTLQGVEVAPLVAAELDRRHPERAIFHATQPDELRSGWAALETMWAATLDRVAAMPPGIHDISVDDEFSFAQTLRHLVLSTDGWLNQAILRQDQPFHGHGLMFAQAQEESERLGMTPADTRLPLDEVLAVRAERVGQVREFLADVTSDELARVCGAAMWDDAPNADSMTVLDCLRVIFDEEWHHHRFAVRDLDAIDAGAGDQQDVTD